MRKYLQLLVISKKPRLTSSCLFNRNDRLKWQVSCLNDPERHCLPSVRIWVQISRAHIKTGTEVHVCNPCVLMGRWEAEAGDSSRAHEAASLTCTTANSKRLCLKQGGRLELTHEVVLSPTHTQMQPPHMHAHTHDIQPPHNTYISYAQKLENNKS